LLLLFFLFFYIIIFSCKCFCLCFAKTDPDKGAAVPMLTGGASDPEKPPVDTGAYVV
jgi:hypothetical protein